MVDVFHISFPEKDKVVLGYHTCRNQKIKLRTTQIGQFKIRLIQVMQLMKPSSNAQKALWDVIKTEPNCKEN